MCSLKVKEKLHTGAQKKLQIKDCGAVPGGQFGCPCPGSVWSGSPGCPREPVCDGLRVLDTDDDFASGLIALPGRRSGGRPVWAAEAKVFLHFLWISAEAGWGLGTRKTSTRGRQFTPAEPASHDSRGRGGQ